MLNIDNKTIEELMEVSLAMFRKNFFGIFHGAISAKIDDSKFIINTKDAMFDDISKNNLIVLSHKQDYSWQDASIDAFIHSFIYREINEAKYIAYAFPPFSVAYSLNNTKIIPQDYFGYKKCKEILIYDPKEYNSWYERADVEICNFLKQNKINFIVVKGYGIYIYDRDIYQLAKTIAIIENSAKILLLSKIN
ncbi:hypothetical protein CCY99_06000 [Helicobacter sp. 16-1353]|uniref:class II aldolase and adducin N-terminal domain-containing protein n=1 Tax=Helicobacter sp. 16-1353 TaxID=2004996 RepID=UPI000DCF5E22|nr:class II aldolase and adducin N-terminal domain-containing protein [Helicobacter sp. 16-1353]RAX53142.1 hypothetical protein CCY99_06000 [Helicobacter sp. 16-1353]